MRAAPPLRHALPGLPAFLWQLCGVYMCSNGLSHSPTVFCRPHRHRGGVAITFDEVLTQALELLKRQGRVSYRALKMRFDLDDEYLDVLKEELIDAQRIATDEDGRILVWVGDVQAVAPQPAQTTQQPTAQVQPSPQVAPRPPAPPPD